MIYQKVELFTDISKRKMKVRTSVKKRSEDCVLVKRKGRILSKENTITHKILYVLSTIR
jgi:ribosomal protein L36